MLFVTNVLHTTLMEVKHSIMLFCIKKSCKQGRKYIGGYSKVLRIKSVSVNDEYIKEKYSSNDS